MPHNYILTLLQKSYNKPRWGNRRSLYDIHVSDIFYFCSRRLRILMKEGIPLSNSYFPMGTGLTFDIGEHIEDIVIKRARESGQVFGNWYCQNCKTEFTGLDPKKCHKCSSHLIDYLGFFLSEKWGGNYSFVGNVDMILSHPQYGLIIHEIKSINPEEFDSLKMPLIQHQWQAQGYLYLASKNKKLFGKSKVHSEAVILYVSKLQKQIPFKTFTITLTDEYKNRLTTIQKELAMPRTPKRICKNASSLMAKKCACINKCFRSGRLNVNTTKKE